MPDQDKMKISQLFIYPVKSLAGIAVSSARLTTRGLAHDRRWMVIDDQGNFITQRKVPVMAQIKTRLNGTMLHLSSPQDPAGIEIPLVLPDDRSPVPVVVWDVACPALVADETANRWLSHQLSRDCRLVYMPATSERWAKSTPPGTPSLVSFADNAPLMVMGQSSLDDLNTRLDQPVSIERFRPNLVVDTSFPFEEDGWTGFQIRSQRFVVIKPCARCVLINVNPLTAVKGKEPLATLAGYRRSGKKVLFGQQILWDHSAETTSDTIPMVAVGDKIICE